MKISENFQKLITEFKSYPLLDKMLLGFGMLAAGTLLFYHGFIHTGIIKLPAAKAADCGNSANFQTHLVEIKNQAFSPNSIQAKVCDHIKFINREDTLHEPAVGPHPTHTSYPGFDAKRPLQKGETFEFILNRPGTYSFHDHLHEEILGSINITQ